MAEDPVLQRLRLERSMIERQGGFTVSSFDSITQVVEEYRQHRGLDPSTMLVLVLLRSGEAIAITGVRAAISWTVLLTEDGTMRIVPNTEIVGIDVRRREGPAPKRPVGFSFERVAEETSDTG